MEVVSCAFNLKSYWIIYMRMHGFFYPDGIIGLALSSDVLRWLHVSASSSSVSIDVAYCLRKCLAIDLFIH